MPVTLPPITRRRFLATSVSATAAVALSGCAGRGRPAAAASSGRDPDHVVFLSDTHVAADAERVARNVNMTANLRQTVSEVLALDHEAGPPSRVIVNGDVAYSSGQAGDYAQFLSVIAPLREAGLPVHLGLGNHDHRERIAAAVPAEQRPLPDRRTLLLELPRANVLLLDSLDKTNSTPGLLGRRQINWLAMALDHPRYRHKPAIVALHHQPQTVPTRPASTTAATQPRISGLLDTPALMEVLLPRRQVKMLCFGHTHVWSHKQQEEGLHLVNLPTTAYVFNPQQPSAWTACRLGEAGATLTLHTLNKSHGKNGETLELDWRA